MQKRRVREKSMRLVMKFGGGAVADGEKIKTVADLIGRCKEEGGEGKESNEMVVVTSAIFEVTDILHENAVRVAKEGEVEKVKEFVEDLKKKHEVAASEAIGDKRVLNVVKKEIRERMREMEKALIGICLLGELTARSLDYIVSFGERLAAPILAGTLQSIGMDAVHLTGGDAGIITNEDYGNAQLTRTAEETIRARIMPLLDDNKTPVVSGYTGETKKGIITTLGRGGSDYTATIIGAAIDALERNRGDNECGPQDNTECKKDTLYLIRRGDGIILFRRFCSPSEGDRTCDEKKNTDTGEEFAQA
jgi:aspartate kinase